LAVEAATAVVEVADGLTDAETLPDGLAVAETLPDGLAVGETLPDGLAKAATAADWLIVVVLPPVIARIIPRVNPKAIGMARGTAIRAARLFLLRRRHADRCPLGIQSTSMYVRCDAPKELR
jgi:hypothetical protein